MAQIIVRVRDERKAELLLELLASLDFVDVVESSIDAEDAVTEADDAAFFALAGIWEDRQIDADSIRQQAWPRQ